ncbi:DUF6263 family protein [Mangrovivirga cuniculi]|nr:DUF6263 family protein [Mangrovivirga cuniculi]
MTRQLKLLPVLIFIGVAISFAFTIIKNEISYDFNEGDKFKYSYSSDTKVVQTIMSQKQEIENSSVYVFDINVLEASGSSYTMEAVISSFKNVSSANGNVSEYDSEDPEKAGGQTGMIYKNLKGHKYSFKIDNNGNISDLEGADELVNKIVGSLENLPPAQVEMLKSQLEASMSKDQIAEMFNQIFITLKDGGASKGDTWNKTSEISVSSFSMKATKDFNYASTENKMAKVDIKGNMKTSEGATMNLMGMPAKINLSGQLQGEALLDSESIPQKALFMQVAKGDVKITEPTSGQLMVIPMELTTQIKVQNLE